MKNSYLRLHFVVFIWGFTAILGDLITQEAMPLVWNRMGLAVAVLFIYVAFKKINLKISFTNLATFIFAGVVIAAHWVTFFHAIKISNVSVTLACLSSGAFFTSLLEPIFLKKKFVAYEMILGLLVVVGIATIFTVESQYKWGILTALTSAFLSALFSVINGVAVKNNSATVITTYELFGGWLALTLFFIFNGDLNLSILPTEGNDLIYILILAVVCTAYPFIESVRIMKELSPFTVVLTINLEPVYGIIMAFFLLGEDEKMSGGFYLGALIILFTVFANAYIKKRGLPFLKRTNIEA
jgi:drug/metabolite transporter (DMT)-like permease